MQKLFKEQDDPMAFLSGGGVSATVEEDENPEIEKEPSQKAPPPAQKASFPPERDTPAKQLRAELDRVKAERDKLKKKLEEAEPLNEYRPLKKIADRLKEKSGGKLDEGVVDEYIERQRTRKQELSAKEKALQEKDQLLKELSIEQSDEWNNEYRSKINKSIGGLIAQVAVVDDDGNIVKPELFDRLRQRLLMVAEDGKTINELQLKGELQKFAKAFEAETGEPYEIPAVARVMDSIELVHSNIKRAMKAKEDWEGTLEEKRKERDYTAFEESQKKIKAEISAREILKTRIIDEINEDEYSFAPIDDIIKNCNNTFTEMTEMLQQKRKPFAPLEGMKILMNGKLFPDLLREYNALKKKIRADKPLPSGGKPSSQQRKPQENEEEDDSSDPRGFLNR